MITLRWNTSDNIYKDAIYIIYNNDYDSIGVTTDTIYTLFNIDMYASYSLTVRAKNPGSLYSNPSNPVNIAPQTIGYVRIFPLKINAGGTYLSDYVTDKAWISYGDYGYSGTSRTINSSSISNDILASARTGDFGYRFRVLERGTYRITIQFAEYWKLSSNARLFNILINDKSISPNPIDIYKKVGFGAEYSVTDTVPIKDNLVYINFNAVVDTPILNGIIIETLPVLTVLHPNGGEEIFVNDTLAIQWSADTLKINDVIIEITTDNGKTWNLILETGSISLASNNWGLHKWVVETTIGIDSLINKDCKIKIRDYNNLYYDISDSTFKISE